MARKRYSVEQIIEHLRQAEIRTSEGKTVLENVEEAVRLTRPFGVDVAGGVEGPVKGVKDPERLARFVAAVRAADQDDG